MALTREWEGHDIPLVEYSFHAIMVEVYGTAWFVPWFAA